ncbi:hypothetical protein [Microlunatus speluncae]|uniref:hypothetical protein n=1 Tax=Microlunatus speluncae TaxID=2594267 RepID=UPI001266252E|nr:hypothetical protein [Microlunatus speluncae]
MSDFPVYQPSGGSGDVQSAAGSSSWLVLVEYSNGGQAKPPTLIEQVGDAHADVESAIAAARQAASDFEPPDPFSPQGRRMFRTGDREFLTIIDGAMSTFHFITRVAEELGSS